MNPAMHISRSDMEKFSGANAFEALPLPRNFFPQLRLSARDRDTYVAQARELLDASLARLGSSASRASQLREYKELGSQSGFRRFAQRVAGGDQRFRVEGTSRSPLQSLMGALVADTTAQAKARRASLYRDLLDAQTLAVLQPRAVSLEAAAQEEFVALRWQAVSLGAGASAQHWDMCVLEYTGVATDTDGFPVGFHLTTAVERAEVGLLKQSYGLSRLRGTEALLLFPSRTSPGHTDVVLDGVWREPEAVSPWVVQGFLAAASAALAKLALVAQEQALARLPLRDKRELVPPGDRKTCNVCLSKFGLMSKKTNCRSCGEVVCRSCVVSRAGGSSSSGSSGSSSSSQPAKFCKRCLADAYSLRGGPQSTEGSSLSGHSFDRDDRRSSASSASASRYTSRSGSGSGSGPASVTNSTAFNAASSMRRFGSETSMASSRSAGPLAAAGYATPRFQRIGSSSRLAGSGDAAKGLADSGYGLSLASTASVSSFDSFSDSVTDRGGSEFLDVDEDGVLVVSAKSAARAMGGPPSGSRAVVPSVQSVEDSIAHQRFLLNEMMSQARTYHQQQQQQQQQQQTRVYRQFQQ